MKKLAILLGIFCGTFFFSQKNQNYLQVGYASICCGTPSEDPVINYISKFQKKNKTKPFEIYRESGLGREGEFNLYIGVDALAKRKKSKFISGLKAAIFSQNAQRKSNSGNVNFDEAQVVTKADLANSRNLTIYKK
ncbi:hypothetical protein CEY12_06855 [Chryseobacterium sp. T16E-39]|uniref:hypothetical protein n=1 Tax=Chryseobacterium sp. T16E-39 TaxID=2015076 RepID=UPI000B5B4352|nr:hypothetical protein [Chryseobacterium sp. T16E-39]ASK29844.1 hypothetical protein CEY12_06855 [Chryseobacterium sp. T16E-39]